MMFQGAGQWPAVKCKCKMTPVRSIAEVLLTPGPHCKCGPTLFGSNTIAATRGFDRYGPRNNLAWHCGHEGTRPGVYRTSD